MREFFKAWVRVLKGTILILFCFLDAYPQPGVDGEQLGSGIEGIYVVEYNRIWNTETKEIIVTHSGWIINLTPHVHTVRSGVDNTAIHDNNTGYFIAEIPGNTYTFSIVGSYLWSDQANAFKAYSEAGNLVADFSIPEGLNVTPYPSEVRYRKSNTIYKRDFTTTTEQTVGSFLGTFATWFNDGEYFLTLQSNVARLYSKDATLVKAVSLTITTNLGGCNGYFWAYNSSGAFFLYRVESPAVEEYNLGRIVNSQFNTITFRGDQYFMLPFKIMKLDAPTPSVASMTVRGYPVSAKTDSAGNWVAGYGLHYGTMDGPIDYLTLGTTSISASTHTGKLAMTTADGYAVLGNFSAGVITPTDTIDLAPLGFAEPGRYYGSAMQVTPDGKTIVYRKNEDMNPDYTQRAVSLNFFDLTNNTLVKEWNYNVGSYHFYVDDYQLSEDGTKLTQKLVQNFTNVNFFSPIDPYDSVLLDTKRYSRAAKISPTSKFSIASAHQIRFNEFFPLTEDEALLVDKDGNPLNLFTGYSPGWFTDSLFMFNRLDSTLYLDDPPDPVDWKRYYSLHIYSVTGEIDTQYTLPTGLGTPQQIANKNFTIFDLQRITDHEFFVNHTAVIDIETGEILFSFPFEEDEGDEADWVRLGPDHLVLRGTSGLTLDDFEIVQWRETLSPLWYRDEDDDGFGDLSNPRNYPEQPEGYVSNSTDCNDEDDAINPNTIWYADTDGDGYGDSAATLTQCAQPEGYVSDNTDCDDTDEDLNPGGSCLVTGIEDAILKLSVFPNPGSGVYFIEHRGADLKIDVINMLGQAVPSSVTKEAESYRLDISPHRAGIYYLKISTDVRQLVQKVLKR